MTDTYANFAELREAESSEAYRISPCPRGSRILVAAPHGGAIEPHTSRIARAIAGTDLSFYLFEGKKDANNSDLHITSTNFDEPTFEQIVGTSEVVLAVHGKRHGADTTHVGGAFDQGILEIVRCLERAGFIARRDSSGRLEGRHPANLCNRGLRGHGLQLEIERPMRDGLAADANMLARYAASVRTALRSLQLI